MRKIFKSKKSKIIIILAIILLISFPLCSLKLSVSNYKICSNKIKSPFRIVQVSDLHSCKYGKNEEQLIEKIQEQNPDIVVLTGDIFDDVNSNDNTEIFLKKISALYPSYYVTGNHEARVKKTQYEEKMNIAKNCYIIRLQGESKEIFYNNTKINLCGIDDDELYKSGRDNENRNFSNDMKNLAESVDNSAFTVLLSHKPNHMKLYSQYNFDLVLCGHAHGGQFIIPFTRQGILAPDQGFFPKYTKGTYSLKNTAMIVSTGLSKKYPLIPRIYNRPEIVTIDLLPSE